MKIFKTMALVAGLLTATIAMNATSADAATYLAPNGLWYGNMSFFLIQLKALSIVVSYSFIVSYFIFKFINLVLPMRVSLEDEALGLDATQHNEKYGRRPDLG